MKWGVARISRDQDRMEDEVSIEIIPEIPYQAYQFIPKDRIDPTILNALGAYFDPASPSVPIVWRLVGMDFASAIRLNVSSELEVRFVRMPPSSPDDVDRPPGWAGRLASLGVLPGLVEWLEE
jgi:hypothetical protein